MRHFASPEDSDETADSALDFKIINWIGIIEQLSSTKARHLLEATDVPLPQFALLNHFSHRPDEGKTVTGVANAMQQPQPGITKTLAKLVKKGFLREEPNELDGRSKSLYITDKGLSAHQNAKEILFEGLDGVFDGWRNWEKRDFFNYLDRLKIYMDENR